MSFERLNKNFQEFLRSVHEFPERSIEKSTLIQMLNEFVAQNPELENIYDDVCSVHQSEKETETTEIDTYSRLQLVEPRKLSDPPSNLHGRAPLTRDLHYAPSSNFVEKVVVHQGDLKVRKESAVLAPLVKKLGLKTVYGELAAEYHEGEKIPYFTVYQSRKSPKRVHKFLLDESCSFSNDSKSKRDFTFRHTSGLEFLTAESGTADSWTSCFESMLSHPRTEIYEVPEDFPPAGPARPPPRPTAPHPNPISPENIFVCLYDHQPTTYDRQELEFRRGDLLHIVNRDGERFYVGHKLTSLAPSDARASLGLVFKDFIQPAYEKAY